MANLLRDYFSAWYAIMVRPIYFYAKLKEENWREKALTFLLVTSWIMALLATASVFLMQYLPIGSTLIEGIAGIKFIIILPVLMALAGVFFLITFLIFGGVFTFAFFALLFFAGMLLHGLYLTAGGKGSLNRMIQSSLYSSAVLLGGILVFALMVLTKLGGLDFSLFRVGYNFIYFLLLIYLYGIWAIAGKKAYGISRWKALSAAIIPIIILLIFGVLFDKMAVSKLQPWIT